MVKIVESCRVMSNMRAIASFGFSDPGRMEDFVNAVRFQSSLVKRVSLKGLIIRTSEVVIPPAAKNCVAVRSIWNEGFEQPASQRKLGFIGEKER